MDALEIFVIFMIFIPMLIGICLIYFMAWIEIREYLRDLKRRRDGP